MAYRLKTVRYQNSDCKILLQNENGPCPLLAAANALLLKKTISLPSESIRSGVASIDDVVNVLAEKALLSTSDNVEVHLDELLNTFPKLQYGMDVNPKFTQGVTGVEYTTNLSAFDVLHVDLVHGWLLDPQDVNMSELVRNKTYNELIEVVVHGNEATQEVQVVTEQLDVLEKELSTITTTDDDEVEQEDKVEQEEEWVNVKSEVKDGGDETSPTTTTTTIETTDAAAVANDLDASAVLVKNEDSTATTNKDDMPVDLPTKEETVADVTTDESKKEASDVPLLLVDDTKEQDVVNVETAVKETSEEDDTATKEVPEAAEEPTTKEAKEPLPAQSLSAERKEELQQELETLKKKREELSTVATNGSLINSFLSSTGHQLTHYGLHELYEYLQEESLCVFFRNNHFATLTKHEGVLYLLVTDLGYANVPEVMWEKLDGIDGDTEYVNAAFQKPAPQEKLAPAPGPCLNPEDVLAQRGQVDADMQLALELSRHDNTRNVDEEEGKLVAAATEASLLSYNGVQEEKVEKICSSKVDTGATVVAIPPSTTNQDGILDGCSTQEDSDKLIAMQMQAQMDNEDASLQLARKLQAQERQQQQAAAGGGTRNNTNTGGGNGRRTGKSGSKESCVIS